MEQFFLLYLAIFQTLSSAFGTELFKELANSSECYPPNFADPNNPTCSFLISANVINKVKLECIQDTDLSHSALRIVGEFRVLKIICTATFLIDFRYYGIQPTEAMMIDWYRGIEPNSDKLNQNFTVEVKIYSVQELFEFYSNVENSHLEKPEEFIPPQTAHDYSRTGHFEFHGMYNKTRGTSFYIFLEDGAKPSFLRNPKTVPRFLGNDVIIPCIFSHFESDVELTKVPSSVIRSNVNIVRSPIDGFIIKSKGSESADFYGNYECILRHKGVYADRINFEFNANSTEIRDKLFGLENFNFENGDNLEVSVEPIKQGNYLEYVKPFCKAKSVADPVDRSKLKLISVPVHNFAHGRLAQQFANPKFFNRSYAARMFNISTGDMSEYTALAKIIKEPVGQIFTAGILYCTMGYSEKYVSVGMTIRGHAIVDDYALDWTKYDLHAVDKIHFFGLYILNKSRPLYAGTITSFACKILTHGLFRPIVWYTENQNGTRVEEKIDYDLVIDTFTWNANLSMDVTKVICAASFWSSERWIETSINVALQDIEKPVINQVETTRILKSGSKGTTLKCTAWGNPKPNVYFEKDGFRLASLHSANGTVIIFDEIDSSNAGTYTCVASNGKEARQDFIINVTTANFDLLVIVIPVVVFFLSAIAFLVYIKFFRLVKTKLTKEEINDFLEGVKEEQIPDGDEFSHGFASMNSYKTEYEIAPDRFIVDENRVLGSGAFGIVKLGQVDNKTVAVKTTQKNAEKQYLKALLSELKIMIYLGSNPNLVQIVGAYTKDLNKGIVYVFVEYVSRGNLQSYLRNNKDNFRNEFNSNESVGQGSKKSEYTNITPLTHQDFLQWSRQIADGMDYLCSKQVIHGDLATRNVLLDDNLNVKITDFGLSRKLYEYNEYMKKQREPLPWRWLALESLKYMKFSPASDVWSFGITIWEIYSLGEIPYPGYTWTMDFVSELQNGMRMKNPKYGSEKIYAILSQCWHEDPKQRPSFKELKFQLDELGVSDNHSREIDNTLAYAMLELAKSEQELHVDSLDTKITKSFQFKTIK